MWCIPTNPVHERLRHNNHEFEVSLDYTVGPCLEKKNRDKGEKKERRKEKERGVTPKL
jgi:hypothetical protein